MASASVLARRCLPAVLLLWVASVLAPLFHAEAPLLEGSPQTVASCDGCATPGPSLREACREGAPCDEPHHHHHPVPHHDVHHCSVCSWVLQPHLLGPDPLPAPQLLLQRLLVHVDPVAAPELRLHVTSARGPPAAA